MIMLYPGPSDMIRFSPRTVEEGGSICFPTKRYVVFQLPFTSLHRDGGYCSESRLASK